MTPFGTPSGTGFELFWAKSGFFAYVIWRVRSGGVPEGVQNDPFLTPFGTPSGTGFELFWAKSLIFQGVIWRVRSGGVQKGVRFGPPF